MQTTSDLYKALLAGPHRKEIKADIAGVEYREAHIVSLSTSGGLFESWSPGNASAKRINLKIFPQGTIPRQAEIRLYVRLTDGEQYSEWIPKGVFYLSTRDTDKRTGVMTVLGYDAMLKAEELWMDGETGGEVSSETVTSGDTTTSVEIITAAPADAVAAIASRIGVDVDSRTRLNAAFQVKYTKDEADDLTMRDVLRHVAIANAGNWRLSDAGKLLLVPMAPKTQVVDLGLDLAEFYPGMEAKMITGVDLLDGDGYLVGRAETISDLVDPADGRTLTATVPYGTSEMALNILNAFNFYLYRPYEGKDALINPAAELGDGITVCGVRTVLAKEDITFDALYSADISAPATDEVEDEYPYLSGYEKNKIAIAKTKEYVDKKAENFKVQFNDGTEFDLLALGIKLGVLTITDEDGNRYVLGDSIKNQSITYDKLNIAGSIKETDLDLNLNTVLEALRTTTSEVNSWKYNNESGKIDGSKVVYYSSLIPKSAYAELGDVRTKWLDLHTAYGSFSELVSRVEALEKKV